jgi:hypothetical protein
MPIGMDAMKSRLSTLWILVMMKIGQNLMMKEGYDDDSK